MASYNQSPWRTTVSDIEGGALKSWGHPYEMRGTTGGGVPIYNIKHINEVDNME